MTCDIIKNYNDLVHKSMRRKRNFRKTGEECIRKWRFYTEVPEEREAQ